MTVLLPAEVIQRLKDAVYWTPADVTISEVATTALNRAIRFLEKTYNSGKAFEPRKSNLKGGRPPK